MRIANLRYNCFIQIKNLLASICKLIFTISLYMCTGYDLGLYVDHIYQLQSLSTTLLSVGLLGYLASLTRGDCARILLNTVLLGYSSQEKKYLTVWLPV